MGISFSSAYLPSDSVLVGGTAVGAFLPPADFAIWEFGTLGTGRHPDHLSAYKWSYDAACLVFYPEIRYAWEK